jgi:TatA/E family protein of Tat protein translocase
MTSLALLLPGLPLGLFDIMGGSELAVIFLLVLVFFGGEKMPEFARGLGKVIREFKKAASGVEQEFKRALEEEPAKTPPPPLTYPSTSPNTILPPNLAPPPAADASPSPASQGAPSATPPTTPAASTPPSKPAPPPAPPPVTPYDPESGDFHDAG